MTRHWQVISLVELETAGTDISSPSKFVTHAKRVEGVQDAFRTSGRFDAVVVIHPEGDVEESLSGAQSVANEVRALPGVRDAETLIGRPSDGHGHH